MSLQGRFVWYELMTTDPGLAKGFYTAVCAWTVQKFDGPMDYSMWTAPAGSLGGLMELPAEARAMGAPPHWVGYVEVGDVDAATARAERLGARVLVPPQDIPGTGRFSTVQDPQGGVIAPFHSVASDWKPASGLGTMAWHELYCLDVEAAFAFYAEVFGWVKTTAMDMGPEHGVYQMFGVPGGPELGGMMKFPGGEKSAAWNFYCRVADVEAAAAAVADRGGQVINGPMEVPTGDRIVTFLDPQGAMFSVHQAKKG